MVGLNLNNNMKKAPRLPKKVKDDLKEAWINDRGQEDYDLTHNKITTEIKHWKFMTEQLLSVFPEEDFRNAVLETFAEFHKYDPFVSANLAFVHICLDEILAK